MCCCGCELALALAARRATEAASADYRADTAPRVEGRRKTATFVIAMKQALRWWLVGDTPLARLDRGD